MKVLLLNGSPHPEGSTFTALTEVANAIIKEGIGAETVHVAAGAVHGCIACGHCRKAKRCVFTDDGVNDVLDRLDAADGLIVGSPVYYASPNGALLSFLDRLFFTGGGHLAYKPGAAVVVARRAGTTASLDVLNKYFLISNMPVVPSQYWNMVHGYDADDVRKDAEGLQIMRTLGRNMAWMLRCFAAGVKRLRRKPSGRLRISSSENRRKGLAPARKAWYNKPCGCPADHGTVER